MYLNDKKVRMTIRFTEKQFDFIKRNSTSLGVSPSDFVRILVNSMVGIEKGMTKKESEGFSRENDKTDCND